MKMIQKGMLFVLVANMIGISVSVIRSIFLNGADVISTVFGYRTALALLLAVVMCYRMITRRVLFERAGQSGKNFTFVTVICTIGMVMVVVDLLLFWQETFTPGNESIDSLVGYLGAALVLHAAENMLKKLVG